MYLLVPQVRLNRKILFKSLDQKDEEFWIQTRQSQELQFRWKSPFTYHSLRTTPENCSALSAPDLNPEIKKMLSDTEVKKDSFLSHIQNDIGTGFTALGMSLDILLKGVNLGEQQMKQDILPGLVDSARLLCNAHFYLSMHRRHQIYPKLKPDMHRVAKESKLDSCLFGEKLLDKFKTAQAIKKSSAEFRAASRGSSSAGNSGHSLNFPRRTTNTRFKLKNFVRADIDKKYQNRSTLIGRNQQSYYNRAQGQRFQQRY
ncbi:uncharacterized protein LOC126747786 [Anthonomus grandis grandis]|uniref:uncharacterized protein LOC126747786 n=1 Tax=Anthonomus grandis grandis TaxID=2921223 RepID=UPI0021669BBF|nr:uncharacterized protein LOC126747786 [Anthonomus grandis grandis]